MAAFAMFNGPLTATATVYSNSGSRSANNFFKRGLHMRKFVAIAVLGMIVSGCSTDPYTGEQKVSNTALGAGTGALLGAGAGAVVGATTNAKTGTAALVGAGIGALAGGGVGVYMDNQEAKLRQRLARSGVSVTRQGDDIILNMPSNITFDTDRSDIRPQFYDTLNSVALVLNEFNRTHVEVYGHTDSDGSDSYNYDLSQRRANSVAQYLSSQQVNPARLGVQGMGESRPIASNATPDGKALNRRVEIVIAPMA
jgi:outer membrane protein OmpA-like peptidoglycan-associated protein